MNNGMDISVSYEGLRSSAATMKAKLNTMSQSLQTATEVMNRTDQAFKSNAADELRAKYTSLQAKFNDFYEAITKYTEFLNTTATTYEQADTRIQQIADEVLTSEYNG